MKKVKNIITISLLLLFLITLSACNNTEKGLLLHLEFDEGSGVSIKDSTKNQANANLQYVFTNPEFLPEPLEPEWRETGVKKGSLLFDGYSNYIRYQYDDIKLKGPELTISVWVAPRYYESNDKGTAIVSQYQTDANEGVFLGYKQFGELIFQVGIGDRNLIINSQDTLLNKYEWNYVVAVFNGTLGKMQLYLNGELIDELKFFDGAEIAPAIQIPLYIAKNSEEGSNATASLNMFSGMMDELKIYESVLTSSAIEKTFTNLGNQPIVFNDIWLQNILTDDYYKTQFHGGPYQHWMNEPHAPIYYNGKYHLFFQFNMFGPYFANISWGHLVSDDMVNWIPMKEIITPEHDTVATVGVWSGAATYDSNGVPVLLITAGDNNPNYISGQNIGIARPKDPTDPNLVEWVLDDELAVIQMPGQGRPNEFRDPSVFYEDGVWYMTIASASNQTNGGTALLYSTTDDSFKNWIYRGEMYNIPNQRGDLGSVWELPVVLPVWNEAKTIKKYIFLISPAPADRADNDIFYFVGDFDRTTYRFIPDPDFLGNPHLLDYGNNVFTGPSGFVDPISGKSYIFSIMQDQRKPGDVAKAGWANSVGLTREVYLLDDGSDVGIRPIDAIANYENIIYTGNNLTIAEANEKIKSIQGDMLHIKVTFGNINANLFGIKVRKNLKVIEETLIFYDTINTQFGVRTGLSGAINNYQNITGNYSGSLSLLNGQQTLDIYLDRSLVEVFANEYKAISSRIYPDKTSLSLELYIDSGTVTVESILIAEMMSIYED